MSPTPVRSAGTLVDLAPAYWRILVSRVPRTAADRLARDIRSGRFARDGLRSRARDLRAHLHPDIRERARTEFFPTLDMGHDGLGPATYFD
jgi:hypothetical protein